jgi:hypothetical protein
VGGDLGATARDAAKGAVIGDESEVFAMSMGVRKTDEQLRAFLEAVLVAKRDEIRHILQDYGVPLDAQALRQ